MKIAVFTRTFPTVSQTFVIRQCAALVERGHDVTVFARQPAAGEPEHADVRRFGLAERRFDWSSPPSLAEAAKLGTPSAVRAAAAGLRTPAMGLPVSWAERPLAAARASTLPPFDVVLCHFGPQGLFADWLVRAGALSGPIVTVFHGFDVSGFMDRTRPDVYAGLFARQAIALPVSEHWAARLRELGCPDDRIRVLHMGIRLRDFPFRARTWRPPEPLRLLSVGRMVEKKGFIVAIEALAALRPELPDFTYDIVGDGPERARLETAARASELGDRVRFHGAQPSDVVRRHLEAAHVLLAPSLTAKSGDQEGIPVVLMEAMALGLPVISTRHSGIPELVPADLLVTEHDPVSLAKKLVDLVAEADRWPELGRRSRATVEREFAADALDSELERILEGATRA